MKKRQFPNILAHNQTTIREPPVVRVPPGEKHCTSANTPAFPKFF